MTEDELVAVVQIYRHGERTPVFIYPTNPRQFDFYWPAEAGELTNRGKSQMYELGKFTRKRYKNFLPETFSKHDTRLYTTPTERSNVSSQLFGAGLYPPKPNEIWNNDLQWNPVPIFTSEPHVLHITPKSICPVYRKMYNEALDRYYQRYIQDPASKYIAEKSGMNIKEFLEVVWLFDNCKVEQNMGLDVPEWTKKVYPMLRESLLTFYAVIVENKEMERLVLGPLFNEIICHFEKMSVDSSSGPKLIAFCGHDTNIATILKTLQSFTPHFPHYGSSIFFELRKKNGEHFVNVFYKSEEVAPVQIAGKYFDISLEGFKELYIDLVIDKEEFFKKCSLAEDQLEGSQDTRPF